MTETILPGELPDVNTIVSVDTETTGLFPDDGAQVTVVSVAWHEGDHVHEFAWPFNQGLYGKPELERAYFGVRSVETPLVDASGEPILFKSGARKGEPKTKKSREPVTWQEALPPNPNLGPDDWKDLCRWLLRHDLSMHNGLFDVIMMGTEVTCWSSPEIQWTVPGVDLLDRVVWETMLGNRILDPQHPLGLEATAARLFDGGKTEEQDVIKAHLKSRRLPIGKGHWHLADWNIMEPYAKGDASLTVRAARHQWRRMRHGEAKFSRMHEEIARMRTLIRMERKGVPYDKETSLKWAEKLEERLEQIEDALPYETRPNAVRDFYFTEGKTDKGAPCLGLKPEKRTEISGEPAIDAEVVQRLVDKKLPYTREYQEWRSTNDAVSRYYRGYAEAVGNDGRLRTRFRQTAVQTRRLSAERVNLMAIPHDHRLLVSDSKILTEAPSPRALIHAIPGYQLVHMDLKQAELRVATEYAECQTMWDILADGRDPHGETALALNLATGPEDPKWYKARSVIGKRSNFSLIFGIGPKLFRGDLGKNGVHMSLSAVQGIHTDWNSLYPEFSRAIKIHMRTAERDGWTRIRDDIRKYYTEREKLFHDWHKAFNNRVQGNIGLFTQEWMVQADDYLDTQGLDPTAGLMLQIHDALLVMVPEGPEGWAMAEHCADLARFMWQEWFTVPGGVDVEPWTK